MKSPCWQCIRRYPACHGTCGDYAKFRMELDADNKKRRREIELRDYEMRTAARMAKRRHLRGEKGCDQ